MPALGELTAGRPGGGCRIWVPCPKNLPFWPLTIVEPGHKKVPLFGLVVLVVGKIKPAHLGSSNAQETG